MTLVAPDEYRDETKEREVGRIGEREVVRVVVAADAIKVCERNWSWRGSVFEYSKASWKRNVNASNFRNASDVGNLSSAIGDGARNGTTVMPRGPDLEAGLDEITVAIPLLPLPASRHESSLPRDSPLPNGCPAPRESLLPNGCPVPSVSALPPASHVECNDPSSSPRWSFYSFPEEPRAGPSSAPDQPAPGDCYSEEDNINKSLWKAVEECDPSAVKELLASSAPLAAHLPLCSLLHWCIEHYTLEQPPDTEPSNQMEIVMKLLSVSPSEVIECFEHADKRIRPGLLSRVIYRGNFKLIQMLVEKGASVTKVTKSGESALHMATRYPHILKYFLDNFDIPNGADEDGLAPIHWAAVYDEPESMKLLLERFGDEQLTWRTGKGCVRTAWHHIVEHDSNKVAEFLLQSPQYRKGINLKDEDGDTPFYYSASCGYKTLTASLLRMGSYFSDKSNNGKTVVEQIVKNVNEPLKLLEDTFDQYIYNEGRVVSVDFYFLSDYDDSSVSQIDVIKEMVRCGLSKILVHPLIESLLYLRWKTLLPVFYTMLAIYAAFLIPFNVYLVNVFNKSGATNTSCPTSASEPCVECYDGWGAWVLLALIYFSICLMLAQECMYIWLRKRQYFVHSESWLKLSVLALGAAVPMLVRCEAAAAPAPWRRHAACLALLLSWLQAMLLLSRFPRWGYYVLMFERVAFNIFKVFATAACLVVGFALCFMIQYQSQPPFDGPLSALIKTLVMMSSEFDYGDLFGEDHEELEGARTVVRLLFVLFVIFVAIVLMNFMIGVAVSDVNELNVIGNIRRLEKQVELLDTLEVVGDTVLGKYVKPLSRVRYHHTIVSNLEYNKKWEVVSIGNDSDSDVDQYAQTLPLYIKEALMNVVKKKQLTKEQNEIEQKKENKLNALYDAVVGIPYSPDDKENDQKLDTKEIPPGPILNEKIKSLEVDILNVKKELNQKVDELQAFMKDISANLAIMADALSSKAKDGDTLMPAS